VTPPIGTDGNARRNFIRIFQLEDARTGLPIWQGEATLGINDKGPEGAPLSIEEAKHQLMLPLPARPQMQREGRAAPAH
jgi:hypothetical protein